MSNRVLKWPVVADGDSYFVSGTPVFVACTDDKIYDVVHVWTLSSESVTDETRKLQIFATGQPVPDDAVYVGTALAAGGALVWHVFDVGNVSG